MPSARTAGSRLRGNATPSRPARTRRATRSGQIEQLLVETAEATDAIDQMDFENPVTDSAARVLAPHRLVRSGHDVPLDASTGDLPVWELPEQVTGDATAEVETLGVSHPDDEVEQFRPCDTRMAVEIVAAGLPHPGKRIADGFFVRIVAQHESAAEV